MILTRTDFRQDGIFGTLTDEDGVPECLTLEHSYDGVPKIPAGQYLCVRGWHTLHSHPEPFETFEITGVHGHHGLVFHWGNINEDSDGCVLLGRARHESEFGWMLTQSRDTFNQFMADRAGIDSFPLTVRDGVPA